MKRASINLIGCKNPFDFQLPFSGSFQDGQPYGLCRKLAIISISARLPLFNCQSPHKKRRPESGSNYNILRVNCSCFPVSRWSRLEAIIVLSTPTLTRREPAPSLAPMIAPLSIVACAGHASRPPPQRNGPSWSNDGERRRRTQR